MTDTPSRTLGAWIALASVTILAAAWLVGAGDILSIKIGAMALLALGAMTVVRFDIGHPYVWFGGTFTLYSVSGPLLHDLGVHPYLYWGGWPIENLDFRGAMDLQFLALAVALAVICPARVRLNSAADHPDVAMFCKGAFPVVLLGIALGAVNVVEILGQGFSTKGEYVLYGGWTTKLSFAFNVLATALGVYLAGKFRARRSSNGLFVVLFVIVAGLLVVLLVGQRHFLFRAGLVIMMVLHVFWRPLTLRTIAPIALGALMLGTVLGGLKMVVVVDDEALGAGTAHLDTLYDVLELRNPELAYDSAPVRITKLMLAGALGTEAMTAGNNLAMILSRVPSDLPFFNGETILLDIARALLPGFLVAQHVSNTGEIYNELVFPGTAAVGGGVGFSIVGYGYLHFGIAGVVLVMVLVGGAVGAIYRWAARSAMGLFFFIGFVPVAAYVARTDITAPLSQGIKHVLLPLVLMLIAAVLMSRSESSQERRGWVRRRKGTGFSRHPERERRGTVRDRRSAARPPRNPGQALSAET